MEITARFRALRRLRFEDTKAPEKFRDFREMSPWLQIQSLMVVVSKRMLLKSCYFLALSIIRQRKRSNSKGKRKQRFWFRSIFQVREELGGSRFENSLGTCWDSFLFLLKSTIRCS